METKFQNQNHIFFFSTLQLPNNYSQKSKLDYEISFVSFTERQMSKTSVSRI